MLSNHRFDAHQCCHEVLAFPWTGLSLMYVHIAAIFIHVTVYKSGRVEVVPVVLAMNAFPVCVISLLFVVSAFTLYLFSQMGCECFGGVSMATSNMALLQADLLWLM